MSKRTKKTSLSRRLREALKPWREHPDVVKLGILEAQAHRILPKAKPGSKAEGLLRDIIWRISVIREAIASGDVHQAVNHTLELMKSVTAAGLSLDASKGGSRSKRAMGIYLAIIQERTPKDTPETLWNRFRKKGNIDVEQDGFSGSVSYDPATGTLVEIESSTQRRKVRTHGSFVRYFYAKKRVFR